MKKLVKNRWKAALSFCCALVVIPLIAATTATAAHDYFSQAPQLTHPEKATMYAATRLGQRIVAVGDYGVITFSDDGQHFRQAKVPSRAPLTSVFFIEKQGWAVGHDGTVLGSTDSGESWQVLRQQRGQDEVLMSVWFENTKHGLAVGQFGLALETWDGGRTWTQRSLVAGEAGERHLLQLVSGDQSLLLVAAEAGTILRSEDAGAHWRVVQTDNKGSFWTGAALADGTLLMAGMRGHMYRSTDRGQHWREVASGTQQSLTGIAQHSDGRVHVVGLGGASLLSQDGGLHFTATARHDRLGLTAIAAANGAAVVFTVSGQVLKATEDERVGHGPNGQ